MKLTGFALVAALSQVAQAQQQCESNGYCCNYCGDGTDFANTDVCSAGCFDGSCFYPLTCPTRVADSDFDTNPMLNTELWGVLNCMSPSFSPIVTVTASQAWATEGMSNIHKAFCATANDITNTVLSPGAAVFAHIGIARQYGAGDDEIDALIGFTAPFAGFPKIFATYPQYQTNATSSGFTCNDGPSYSHSNTADPMESSSVRDAVVQDLLPYFGDYFGTDSTAYTGYSNALEITTLSLKSKYFVMMTIAAVNNEALPTDLVQSIIQVFMDHNIITDADNEAFKNFVGLYVSFSRIDKWYQTYILQSNDVTPTISIVALIWAIVAFFLAIAALVGAYTAGKNRHFDNIK